MWAIKIAIRAAGATIGTMPMGTVLVMVLISGPNSAPSLNGAPSLHGILLPDDLKVQDQFSPSHNKLVLIREAPRLAPVLELNVAFFAPVSRNGKCFPASRESRLRLSPTHAKQ